MQPVFGEHRHMEEKALVGESMAIMLVYCMTGPFGVCMGLTLLGPQSRFGDKLLEI